MRKDTILVKPHPEGHIPYYKIPPSYQSERVESMVKNIEIVAKINGRLNKTLT